MKPIKSIIEYKDHWGDLISTYLEAFFYRLIYAPMLAVINEQVPKAITLTSAADPPELYLMQRIQDGKIIYDGEYFTGKFDARASRQIRDLGGRWDAGKKAFRLAPLKLTPGLKVAVSASKERLEKIHKGLDNVLGDVARRIEPAVNDFDLSKGIERVIDQLQSQTINAMKAISVKYTLTHGQKERLREDYTDNMKLSIKGWADDHVRALSEKVQDNSMQGNRFTRLKTLIEQDYGQSQSKAKFLARQETSLFMSKFRRERFLEAGVKFYLWSTVRDRLVRPDHRKLDGRVFQFGEPPVVDSATGRRAEPGEDFSCRCVALPVVGPVRNERGEWREVD